MLAIMPCLLTTLGALFHQTGMIYRTPSGVAPMSSLDGLVTGALMAQELGISLYDSGSLYSDDDTSSPAFGLSVHAVQVQCARLY